MLQSPCLRIGLEKVRLLPFAILACALLAVPAQGHAATQWDDKSAVIFAYQRIGDDAFPDASLRTDQFETHIRELTSGDYTVMGLPEIVKALRERAILPPRTVALTFEGAHRSILDAAVPLLLKNNLPFTVFVSADAEGSESPEYLSWEEIRKLRKNPNITIGIQPGGYGRLTGKGRAEILRALNGARASYRDALGEEAALFAYPFGEYDETYHKIVMEQGFKAAFGQQSGVAYPDADLFALPRFTMTEDYGDLDRFRMTARALPLPVTDIEPGNTEVSANPPSIGFTVDPSLKKTLKSLSCFASGIGRPALEIIGESRVELRMGLPFDEDRIRINCTMPGPPPQDALEEQSWRWFGMLLNLPAAGTGHALFIPEPDEPQ